MHIILNMEKLKNDYLTASALHHVLHSDKYHKIPNGGRTFEAISNLIQKYIVKATTQN